MYQKDDPGLFYEFDDPCREVRFLRYDMPTPWMNYLSNGRFTAMLSHAGGGVAFYRSPQIFRINHYRFFHLPTDRSGFYTYIKDGDIPSPEEPLTNYNPGTGENGSVFCHANTWAVIAECMLGHGDRAYEYYHQLIPSVAMERAGVWRYKAEPYVYASNIFGPDSLRFGLANVSWLTGTAAWMYVAVSQYILGVRASYEGLVIDPCLPSAWKGARVTRVFREAVYEIEMQKGEMSSMTVDGEKVEGNLIPYEQFGKGVHRVKRYL